MKVYAQKQHQPQQQSSTNITRSTARRFATSHVAHPLMNLQRTIGNQAVLQTLQTHAEELAVGSTSTVASRFAHDFSRIPLHSQSPVKLQAKLTVNAPGDIYEQEADRVAEQVMRMPKPQLERATMEKPEAQPDLLGIPNVDDQAIALESTAQPKLTMSGQAESINLIQRQPESRDDQGDCSGWESDCESFCHSAAKQYWVDIDGVQPPLVKKIDCTTPGYGQAMCIVTFDGGMTVSVAKTGPGTLELWRRQEDKPRAPYVGPACKYKYHCTAKDNLLVLERISCKEFQPQLPKQEQGEPEKSSALQRSPTQRSEISQPPPIVHEVLNSPGRPLDPATNAFMGSRFGHDFSCVRVHSDSVAAAAANAVNAKAFTVRNAIVFGAGQYSPASSEGRRLLAHELTHVVQQQAAPSSKLLRQRLPTSLPAPVAQRSSGRLFRKEDKTVLEKEGITDKKTVDDAAEVQRIVLATLSNPTSKLFPYLKGKLKNLKEGKTKYTIDDPAVFAHYYREHAKRRNKKIDPSVKDEDLVKDIGGFFDPTLNTVFLKTRSDYCSAFHETIHSFSSPDLLSNELGGALMEGLTQYFTDKVFMEQVQAVCTTHKYGPHLACAEKLVTTIGFDEMASLFFLYDTNKLHNNLSKLGIRDKVELRQLGSHAICNKLSSPLPSP